MIHPLFWSNSSELRHQKDTTSSHPLFSMAVANRRTVNLWITHLVSLVRSFAFWYCRKPNLLLHLKKYFWKFLAKQPSALSHWKCPFIDGYITSMKRCIRLVITFGYIQWHLNIASHTARHHICVTKTVTSLLSITVNNLYCWYWTRELQWGCFNVIVANV